MEEWLSIGAWRSGRSFCLDNKNESKKKKRGKVRWCRSGARVVKCSGCKRN